MSYPRGTTLNNFHFTKIHKNALPFSQDGSQQLANLLYHVSRVDCHLYLAIKINLLQLKDTRISNIFSLSACFSGTPPHADIIASFQGMQVKTHDIQRIVFSMYHGKISHLSLYLCTW